MNQQARDGRMPRARITLTVLFVTVLMTLLTSAGLRTKTEDGSTTNGHRVAPTLISEPATMRQFMGINTSLGSYDSNLIGELGSVFKWIREYHKWHHLEPANDLYLWDSTTPSPYGGSWPNHHDFITACAQNQIDVLICVEQATNWSSSDGSVTGLPVSSGDGSSESDYAERAEYMAQIAARYGQTEHPHFQLESNDKLSGLGLVSYFEDFNEQNQDWQSPLWPAAQYGRFLNAVHDGSGVEPASSRPLLGVKGGDAQAFHVMGGLAGADTDYLDEIFRATGGRLPFDALNIHLYCTDYEKAYAPEHPVFGLKPGIDKIVNWRNENAPGKEIWLTEFGWDTYVEGPRRSWVSVPELAQANYLMRSFALLKGWGIDKAFMFIFRDPSSTDPLQFASSGIIRDTAHGHSRKLSYYYLATMQHVIGDLALDQELPPEEGSPTVHRYRFIDPDETRSTIMLWSRDPLSENDNGATVDDFPQSVPMASTCRMIRPEEGSLTGIETVLPVGNPGTPDAAVQIPQISETPLFVECAATAQRWLQYVPFSQQKDDSFLGIAVSNLSNQPANLELTGFTADGASIPSGIDPSEMLLPPRAQFARLVNEVFASSEARSAPSWILVESDIPEVGGFFLHGNNTLSRLDGAITSTRPVRRLIFTRTPSGSTSFRGKDAETEIWLVNPSLTTLQVELSLVKTEKVANSSQVTLTKKSVGIPARGTFQTSVKELFEVSATPSYIGVDVVSGEGVIGFERITLAQGETVVGLAGVQPGGTTRFYSAQLAHSPTLFTHLRLVNTAEEDRTVSIGALRQDGAPLPSNYVATIPAGHLLEGDVRTLLWAEDAAPDEFTGSLIVEVDGAGIVGNVIFGDPVAHRFAAALPLSDKLFVRAIFSHVANTPPFFTGLALFNPQEAEAQIHLEVLDRNGQPSGESTFPLKARGRLASLLTELIPTSAGQDRGQVVVSSSVPIVGQQLFGTFSLELLAAVPPSDDLEQGTSVLDSTSPSR